jgi:hypothetical protein
MKGKIVSSIEQMQAELYTKYMMLLNAKTVQSDVLLALATGDLTELDLSQRLRVKDRAAERLLYG